MAQGARRQLDYELGDDGDIDFGPPVLRDDEGAIWGMDEAVNLAHQGAFREANQETLLEDALEEEHEELAAEEEEDPEPAEPTPQ